MRLLETWRMPWDGETVWVAIVSVGAEFYLCVASDGSRLRLSPSDVQVGRAKPAPVLRLVN